LVPRSKQGWRRPNAKRKRKASKRKKMELNLSQIEAIERGPTADQSTKEGKEDARGNSRSMELTSVEHLMRSARRKGLVVLVYSRREEGEP